MDKVELQSTLKEVSISDLFISGEENTYEIPIYQRNFAWEKDEITTLIEDVYDSYIKDEKSVYYIGTLVTYHKGDGVYEVIDGQQRLTTIFIILKALNPGSHLKSKLTYRARVKSDETLKRIPNFFNLEDKDKGIENGFKYAQNAINNIFAQKLKTDFLEYFYKCVHIIHYTVPNNIDLNHYFEIMNSRGEQLEKHEIVKAKLMGAIDEDSRQLFNDIWESCSNMNTYIQRRFNEKCHVFGTKLSEFIPKRIDDISIHFSENVSSDKKISISDILKLELQNKKENDDNRDDLAYTFQPIIDFPNFLLIVLKITRMAENEFNPLDFQLDDKELLNEFDKAGLTEDKIKKFAFNLLKARFFLDNYIVHHSNEDDTIINNPWKLQIWSKDSSGKEAPNNLCSDNQQERLIHLLSMFEVTFTAKQRKNYLFYCLMYLINEDKVELDNYVNYVEELANRYFFDVYLNTNKLNDINTPAPGSFDECILDKNKLRRSGVNVKPPEVFSIIYGDGSLRSKGVPLYIFNYLDFKIWKLYAEELRGNRLKRKSKERIAFFSELGCSDFDLDLFNQFYFSRTRRSLEHYYSQANATGKDGALNQNQINCFGNYAMIGSEANSSGSNWDPLTKVNTYLRNPTKVNLVSVASLKFRIMMQTCIDNERWGYNEILLHQKKMIGILFKKLFDQNEQ